MYEHFKRGKFFKTEDIAIPKIGYFFYEGQHSWLGMLKAAGCQGPDESLRLLTCGAAQKQHLSRPDFIIKFYFKLSALDLVLSSDCCHWDITVHVFMKSIAFWVQLLLQCSKVGTVPILNQTWHQQVFLFATLQRDAAASLLILSALCFLPINVDFIL